MGSASDSEEEVDAKTILAIRTSAKRRHTRQANHLKTLVDGGGTADGVNVALAVLEEAYSEVVRVNAKYKQADKGKEKDAIEWEAEINTFYMGCRKAAEEYSNKEKEKLDAAPNAKKRRLELEFEREQAKLDEQRKLEDIRQQSQREQEDLTLQIEYQRQLEGLKSPGKSSFKPRFTSSINDSDDEKRPRGPWPKISITPFNGDSRTWPDFELSFGALINNTRMPEDMKLLAL
ncbi:hypothetical protein DAPPUDRAFT_329382, partial [Daphnia pulex]